MYACKWAIIRQVVQNDLDEVTEVLVFKGRTCEEVRRHVNSVIMFLSRDESTNPVSVETPVHALRRGPLVLLLL